MDHGIGLGEESFTMKHTKAFIFSTWQKIGGGKPLPLQKRGWEGFLIYSSIINPNVE
jgi:hypothetical protein